MRKFPCIVITIILILIALGPAGLRAQQTARTIDSKGIGYLEHLPPDYNASASKKYPVIIYLHGAGEAGDGSAEDLEKVKYFGPPYHIEHGHNMCFTNNGTTECYIVIAPQISETDHWKENVKAVLDHILDGPDHYRVDRGRVYLTGMSRGGNGVYSFAASSLNNPNRLAAIIPTAAWADFYSEGCTISERKMAVWAFHGGADVNVTLDRGQNAFQSIRDCTEPQPNADLLFTVYPNNLHNVWTEAFDPTHKYEKPNIYEWLLSHTLNGVAPDPGDPEEPEEPDPENPVLAVNEGPGNGVFSIHPNPVRSDLYVKFLDQKTHQGTLSIQNTTGNMVMTVDAGAQSVDLSALQAGIYIVQLKTNRGLIATERLVKVN